MAEMALEQLGLPAGEALFVGDRLETDIVCGARAGISTALVLTGVSRPDEIESAEAKFPSSDSLKRAKRFACLKLMEKHQNTDPFKFIIYSARIGEQTPQINAEKTK